MTKLFRNNRVKLAALTGLLAVMFRLSSHAAIIYSASGSPSVIINAGGFYSPTVTLSPSTSGASDLQITMVQLVLTFANGDLLDGSSFEGNIVLGGSVSDPGSYINFFPTVTSGSGTYSVTFTGTAADNTGLNGLNPNNFWGLIIWDQDSLSGNQLDSWSLDVTAVPEPVNVALGVFGLLFAVVIVARRRSRKMAGNRPV
jgi:hypothetical protein